MCKDDDSFPADIALLTSSADGDCFIATSSLDGEKNLKKRAQASKIDEYIKTNDINVKELLNMKGEVQCEAPNKDLHSFTGQIILNGDKYFTLSDKQLLLKGANLKNIDWAIGIVVYTGNETKIMLNSQEGRQKMSHLESGINKLVINIVVFQCVVSSIMAALAQWWQTAEDSDWDDHLFNQKDTLLPSQWSMLAFFTYFLLLNTLLPISLQVSLEFVKVFQGWLIDSDVLMYSLERYKMVTT